MMYNVIVWGNRTNYDFNKKWLEVEILKNNMQIVGIVFNEKGLFKKIDDIEVLDIESLLCLEYDYIIDMNENAQDKVCRIIELLQISREMIIPIRIFRQPFFDLDRWVKDKKENVSIISSHCWGGVVYNTLGLPFASPTINMFFPIDDFLKMAKNVKHYMNESLELIREEYEVNLQRNYPVVKLDDIVIHCNHYRNFVEAEQTWERRTQRINYESIFIEMTAKTHEQIAEFLRLPYEKKICFTALPCNETNVVSIYNQQFQNLYGDREWQFALGTASEHFSECKQYDLLKLLSGETNFFRVV